MAATETDLAGAEQRALSEGCGLLDRSERGKLALTGAGAVEFLNGQVTNELADLRRRRRALCGVPHAEGQDARRPAHPRRRATAAPDALELLLDTERSSLQALFDMIRRFKVGYDVELHKRTVERGLLSLIGPAARRGVWRGRRSTTRDEHANAPVKIDGIEALAVRTDVAST